MKEVIAAIIGAVVAFMLSIFTPIGNDLIEKFRPTAELSYVTIHSEEYIGAETEKKLLLLVNTGQKRSDDIKIYMLEGAYVPRDKFKIRTRADYKLYTYKRGYLFAPDEAHFGVIKEVVGKITLKNLLPGQVLILEYIQDVQWSDKLEKWHIFDNSNNGIDVSNNPQKIESAIKIANERFPGSVPDRWEIDK
jgi:hypothetical protein